MRVIKSLLLGAAAGLAATAAVQAADMPVKAKAVEYVKICSAYGAGFYYIPGTDICLRVGGFVRVDYNHNANQSFPIITALTGSGAAATHWMGRAQNTHEVHTRVNAIFDARQNTAYGTLRAYFNTGWNFVSGGGTVAHANQGFIQFAGFTFGRAASFFDFYGSTGPHANLVNWGGQTTGAGGHNVLAYTAQFGGGLSGTISLEEPRYKPVVGAVTLGAFLTGTPTAAAPANMRAGMNVPGVAANLRIDQSWGSAQIMAAVQELRTIEFTPVAGGGHSTYGYALGGGFTWNNPSAPGSQFGIQAAWAKGASHYTTSSYGAHLMYDTPFAGSAGSVGFLADGVLTPGNVLNKTTAWGVNAGYQHRFNPNWAFTIHGAYNSIEYNSTVDATIGACGGDCDFNFWSAGFRALWTPVPGLDFALDMLYHEFESMAKGFPGRAGDRDVLATQFRVLRNF